MSANREQKDYLDSVEYRIMQRAFMEMQMKKDALHRARIALEKAQDGDMRIFDERYQKNINRDWG